MKRFFTKELETLKLTTGCNQYERFREMGSEEGTAQARALIDLMVDECNQPPFNLVPEEAKQKAIRTMMRSDADFVKNGGFSAATIHKWLTYYWETKNWKTVYGPKDEVCDVQEVGEIKPETEKMIQEYMANLSGLKEVPRVSRWEVSKADERPKRGSGYIPDPRQNEITQKRAEAIRARGLDKITNTNEVKPFTVEGEIIVARTIEEAQEMYIEIYA